MLFRKILIYFVFRISWTKATSFFLFFFSFFHFLNHSKFFEEIIFLRLCVCVCVYNTIKDVETVKRQNLKHNFKVM